MKQAHLYLQTPPKWHISNVWLQRVGIQQPPDRNTPCVPHLRVTPSLMRGKALCWKYRFGSFKCKPHVCSSHTLTLRRNEAYLHCYKCVGSVVERMTKSLIFNCLMGVYAEGGIFLSLLFSLPISTSPFLSFHQLFHRSYFILFFHLSIPVHKQLCSIRELSKLLTEG